jgi:fumarate reductase flavoprotein subunit
VRPGPATGRPNFEQPDAVAWTVFDQGTVDLYGPRKGRPQVLMEMGELNNTSALLDQSRQPFGLTPVLVEGQKTGLVVKADKLEDLAAKAGLNTENFAQTVARYKAAVAAHNDMQFFKSPYYAFKFTTQVLGTIGAVKIDEAIRAVDDHDRPIPGLWVAGADAGGMYGHDYVQVEGATLGFAYISGRLAGKHAAEAALKK